MWQEKGRKRLPSLPRPSRRHSPNKEGLHRHRVPPSRFARAPVSGVAARPRCQPPPLRQPWLPKTLLEGGPSAAAHSRAVIW